FLLEAFRHRRAMVWMFAVILIGIVLVGLVWPKRYTSYTTILVDEKNIIEPLMQGAAVPTGVADRAKLAREVIFGRKIMNQVLTETGRLANVTTPDEQEEVLKKVMRQTDISNVGRNLIKIQ